MTTANRPVLPDRELDYRPDRTNWAAWRTFERVVACAVIVLLAVHGEILPGVSLAVVAAVALTPIWIREALSYRYARPLVVLFGLAIISGLWLSELSAADHSVIRTGKILNTGTLVGTAVAVGFMLWARRVIPVWLVGAMFGFGLLLGMRIDVRFTFNPWRFGFATPVTVIVLALAISAGRRWVELVCVVALAIASAVSGGRSPATILLLVALLVAWQTRRPPTSRAMGIARASAMLVGIGYAAYSLGQAAILDGLLGEAARERTQMQIAQSGNLIVGGRPEMSATFALMRHFPAGFGLGVVPSSQEVMVAKTGLAGINYDPNNNYVDHYLFGTSFTLHSGFGELWAWLGVVGLVLALALVVLVAGRTIALVTERRAQALTLYLALLTLWNMFFSPILTSANLAALCFALLLVKRTSPQAALPEPRSTSP